MSVNKEILIKDKYNNYSYYDLSDFRLKKLNHFKGWNCYLGQENLSISYIGTTHGAVCSEGPSLGNIYSDDIKLLKKPIKCPLQSCHCGSDVLIKKIKTHSPMKLLKLENNLDSIEDKHINEVDGNYKIRNQKILFLDWVIAKKCNYDCSYCPTHIHNNYSPHIQPAQLQQAQKNLNKLLHTHNQLKITFTGGEPTLNPYFLGFLKDLKKSHTDHIRLITNTNGSRLAKYFNELNHYSALFFSIHLDYTDTNKLLEKISKITDHRRKNGITQTPNFFILKVMARPGNTKQCLDFYKQTYKIRREWNDLQVHIEPIVKKENHFKLLPFKKDQIHLMQKMNKHDKLYSSYKRSVMREEDQQIIHDKKLALNLVAENLNINLVK